MTLHTAVSLKSRYLMALLIPLFLLLSACSNDDGNIQPTPQTIVSVNPAANATGVQITATVSIQFGVDMDKASVESQFTLAEQGGAAVPASVNYDVGSKMAVLTPTSDLTNSTAYTATLSSDVLDAAGGKPLSSNYVWNFSTIGTGGGQVIDSVSPAENSDTALVNTTVTVVFNVDMSASVLSAFSLSYQGSDVFGGANYDVASRTLVFTPNSDLVSGGLYTATIDSTVQDTGGGTPLPQDFVWSFTIAPATFAVSTDANDVLGNNTSSDSGIDSEGRFVVFTSRATNLTSVNSGGIDQVYRKDTQTGEIAMASTDASGLVAANGTISGTGAPAISGDGRYVVFHSDAANLQSIPNGSAIQVYLKDMQTGAIEMVSRSSPTTAGNAFSGYPAISANGNFIVFQSQAIDLDGNTGGLSNIFLFDVQAGNVELVSLNSSGSFANGNSVAPDVSDDGRYVVFQSQSTDLGSCTNGQGEIFVRDRQTVSTTICISVDSGGGDANNASSAPAISGDGTTVVFTSLASDLVGENTGGIANIFARNFTATTPSTMLVSISQAGTVPDNACQTGSVSNDGRYVSFVSSATNLLGVGVDSNSADDVFVRDTQTANDTVRVSVTAAGAQANNASGAGRISDNGRYVSFSSDATNLDGSDTNGVSDVFRAHNAAY